MTGIRFGRLLVLDQSGRDRWGQVRWRCLCDCGKEHAAVGGKLRRGEVLSCGCGKSAACAAANIKHGGSARGRMTPEYRAWQNLIHRCENPKAKQYKDWGGRGIKVSPDWRHDFARFLADVGPRPSPQHSIDRRENDGNYEPGNVRWATRMEQRHNSRHLRMITFGSTTMPLVSWAHRTGIDGETIAYRLDAGWSPERALTEPVRSRKLRKKGASG